jgi:hypothetical protein
MISRGTKLKFRGEAILVGLFHVKQLALAGFRFSLFYLEDPLKPFRAPGRIASGVFILEVSLALVGVASPA